MITFSRLEQVPVGIEGARLGGVSYVIADDPTRTQYFDLDLVVFAAVKLWGEQAAEPATPPTVQTVLTFAVHEGHGSTHTLYVPVSAFRVEPCMNDYDTSDTNQRPAIAAEILRTLPHCHHIATPVVFE